MTNPTWRLRTASSSVLPTEGKVSVRFEVGSRARRVAATAVALAAVLIMPGTASADPTLGEQWHLGALNISAAQGISTGQGVTVAVIDSGVDATNPDVEGQLVTGTCFAKYLQPTDDNDGHGTMVAGLIAAKSGGAGHALGVAPGARIMPICIDTMHIDQSVAERETVQAIHYAVDHGASVINISQGSSRPTLPVLEQAMGYALLHNVVVVAAAGNTAQGDSGVADVARIPGVVAVTGTGRNGLFWSGSAQGPQAGVAAPAVDINSTYSSEADNGPGTYGEGSGTSYATAIVSGVVALIRSRYPGADAVDVINRLVRTADDKGAVGRDPEYGFGVVDPVKALTARVGAVSVNPLGTPPSPSPSGAAARGTGGAARAEGDGGGSGVLVGVLVVGGVVVVVGMFVVAAVLWSRRRRSDGGLVG
jgi:membrane-anchored mycosin MYCP